MRNHKTSRPTVQAGPDQLPRIRAGHHAPPKVRLVISGRSKGSDEHGVAGIQSIDYAPSLHSHGGNLKHERRMVTSGRR